MNHKKLVAATLKDLVLDALREYAENGKSLEFYSCVDKALDYYVISNPNDILFKSRLCHFFVMLMQVVSRLDHTMLKNWGVFCKTAPDYMIRVLTETVQKTKPAYFYISETGHCHYCEKPIINSKGQVDPGSTWHIECFNEYKKS